LAQVDGIANASVNLRLGCLLDIPCGDRVYRLGRLEIRQQDWVRCASSVWWYVFGGSVAAREVGIRAGRPFEVEEVGSLQLATPSATQSAQLAVLNLHAPKLVKPILDRARDANLDPKAHRMVPLAHVYTRACRLVEDASDALGAGKVEEA
jgi:hypothetical protein